MAITKHWQAHIEAWQGSGLTQAAYCRRQDLNSRTFTARLSEFRRERPEVGPIFIPVQVDAAAKTELGSIVLHLTKGHRLELPGTVSVAWLSDLLRRLA